MVYFTVWLTTIGIVDDDGYTPMGVAIDRNKLSVVKYFITVLGVDMNGGL